MRASTRPAPIDGCAGRAVPGLDRLPQPFDEHVIAPRTASIHADADFVSLQDIDEAGCGKLRALVGVEDLRCSNVTADGFLKPQAHRRRSPPSEPRAQNPTAEPIDHRSQIHRAAGNRDVRMYVTSVAQT